ncbi:MAG: glycosyltransferase family 4 protein [Candidatus Sungbacteria bacterium]|uniref:Glycosyltransferase family 4 protein n=1 Tax=Candidatus Sungiibacteriota bacterium TaxID=2750080 RepID=A0A931SBJ2_9BACT|nr:glycosyltransferase family 4 protein [Candidatus Sungbacteria bacterium]
MKNLTPIAPKPIVYVFSTAYKPFIGGAEVAIEEVTARLKEHFDFIVVTARLQRGLHKEEIDNGIRIVRVGIGSPIDKYLLPLIGPFVVRKLLKRFPAALFWGVMVSFASGVPYLINIFRWRKTIPIVLTLQEGDPESHLRKSRFGLIGLAWRAALLGARQVTAISNYLGELAKRFGYRGAVYVIPNGVALEGFGGTLNEKEKRLRRQNLGIPAKAKVLVSTSRLVKKNGIDTAIASLRHIPPSLRGETFLLLVGGGGEEAALKTLAAEMGVASHVVFLGEKEHKEAIKCLELADIFVRPSRSEGMGNSFIEAMAAKIPVIGTPVGGILDFLIDRETGMVVEPDNPQAVAKAVRELLGDTSLRDGVVRQAFQLVSERYGWERIAGLYQSVFFEEIRRAKRPLLLLATGIYPPELGGTARYAGKLHQLLSADGWRVEVLAYTSGSRERLSGVHLTRRSFPTGLRHLMAFLSALPGVWRSDFVVLLDHFSMGFPAALAAFICRKRYLVRVGGDFLWETHVETHRQELALPDLYRGPPSFGLKEKIIYYLARFVLQKASLVIFSTDWQRNIFLSPYRLREANTAVIPNAVERAITHLGPSSKARAEIVYAGRFLFLKNLRRALLVFREFRLKEKSRLRIRLIGEGPEERQLRIMLLSYGMGEYVAIEPPLAHAALQAVIKEARAVMIPSFSDVSPNLALEALALQVPAILTKHCGFELDEKQGVVLVDPFSESSFFSAYQMVENPRTYRKLRTGAGSGALVSSWEELAQKYDELLRSLLKKHP